MTKPVKSRLLPYVTQRRGKDDLCSVFSESAFFSADECRRIIELSEAYPEKAGQVTGEGGDPAAKDRVRISTVKFGQPDEDNQWVFDKLEGKILEMNRVCRFDLQGFFEGYQIARYESGGHYTWHMDIGPGALSARKLSMTLQLSDPADYEGGDLRVITLEEPAPKEQGTLTVFPSYLLHTIEPVTTGVRHSLVSWISGAPWK